VKRRGLVAALTALAAVFVGRAPAPVAQASNGDPLILGQANAATVSTTLSSNTGGTDVALRVENTSGRGLLAIGSPGNVGLRGHSPNSFGIIGTTDSGNGITAVAALNGVGLRAESSGSSGKALVSINSTGGVDGAGSFSGNVFIDGAFSVTGIKSAVVPNADGWARRVYCVEGTEPVFEDFGEASLVNGRAHVRLDAEFAGLVRGDSYYVFLTEYGDNNRLFVANRTPTGFEVRAKDDPRANSAFTYRVVGRRRDVAAPRLEKLRLPQRPIDLPAELRRAPDPPGPRGR
jgi:hypothetical protein